MDSLNVSLLHNWNLKACQLRTIADCDSPAFLGHARGRPAGRVLGLAIPGAYNDLLALGIAAPMRNAGARLVNQPFLLAFQDAGPHIRV